jgi:hypothetical protein
LPSQKSKAEEPAAQGKIGERPEPIAATIPAPVQMVHPPAGQPTCGPDRYQSADEVCAAWKAADAAEIAAKYSLWGLLISGVGTALLLWTLWETREISRRELRAYIRVEPVGEGVVQPERKVSLPFHMINYGATPAVDCCVQSSVVVRPPGWSWTQEPNNVEELQQRPAITIHPDSPNLIKLEMDDLLPNAAHLAILEGRAVVYARGRIEYRDMFRRKRHTSFQIEFHGTDAGPAGAGGRIRIAAIGNDFS